MTTLWMIAAAVVISAGGYIVYRKRRRSWPANGRAEPLPSEPGVSRKRCLDLMLGTAAGGLAVAVLYPVLRYLMPPVDNGPSVNSVTLAFKPVDLKSNSGRIFKFGSEPGIVLRTPAGDVRAFSAVCTHLGCIVQYDPAHEDIWCPCHNGRYDLNGRNVSGPPPRPLARYDVNLLGGEIVVSRNT